ALDTRHVLDRSGGGEIRMQSFVEDRIAAVEARVHRRNGVEAIGDGHGLRAPGPVPGSGSRARLPVRCPRVAAASRATRPVNGSRATRSPVPPGARTSCPLLIPRSP